MCLSNFRQSKTSLATRRYIIPRGIQFLAYQHTGIQAWTLALIYLALCALNIHLHLTEPEFVGWIPAINPSGAKTDGNKSVL